MKKQNKKFDKRYQEGFKHGIRFSEVYIDFKNKEFTKKWLEAKRKAIKIIKED